MKMIVEKCLAVNIDFLQEIEYKLSQINGNQVKYRIK